MIRAVIDTNVWVSAFLRPDGIPGKILHAWRRREFEAHVSTYTIVELARVLGRPRIVHKYQVRWTEVLRFVGDVVAGAVVHHVGNAPRRCRDADDDVQLELATRLAPTSHLVSGDADLAADAALVASMESVGVVVLSPAAFLRKLDEVA